MKINRINEGLKEEYSMEQDLFSLDYDFSHVRQIARADRFAHVPITHQTKRPPGASLKINLGNLSVIRER